MAALNDSQFSGPFLWIKGWFRRGRRDGLRKNSLREKEVHSLSEKSNWDLQRLPECIERCEHVWRLTEKYAVVLSPPTRHYRTHAFPSFTVSVAQKFTHTLKHLKIKCNEVEVLKSVRCNNAKTLFFLAKRKSILLYYTCIHLYDIPTSVVSMLQKLQCSYYS